MCFSISMAGPAICYRPNVAIKGLLAAQPSPRCRKLTFFELNLAACLTSRVRPRTPAAGEALIEDRTLLRLQHLAITRFSGCAR